MRRARFWIEVALFLALFAAIFALSRRDPAPGAPVELVSPLAATRLPPGAIAPDIALTRPGEERALSGLRGRWVLLHFWASWCGPCVDELPALLSRSRAEGAQLAVVAVPVEEGLGAAARFFGGALPPEVFADTSGEGVRRYGVSTLPATFLITPAGNIALSWRDAVDWAAPEAAALFESPGDF